MSLRERFTFLRQLFADFEHTGAVQPSSMRLARAMAEPLRGAERSGAGEGMRILEIGPGTGAVTRGIVEAMAPQDRLECYEINPDFAEFLRDRFEVDPEFRPFRDRVTIHPVSATEVGPGRDFDFVVCSAPLANFPPDVVEALFEAGLGALRPGGGFSYFEYLALPALKRLVAPGRERRRIDAVHRIKEELLAEHRSRSRRVWWNLPPARVRHLQTSSSS